MAVTQYVVTPTEPRPIVGLEWLAKSEKVRLSNSFTSLPLQAQTILQLFYVEELKASEVAFVLDLDILEILKCHDAALSFLRATLH